MARTMVFRESGGDQVPFLRGILTQSLVKAGLTFDEAYGLAQSVRTELKDVSEISSEDLRLLVAKRLKSQFGEERSLIYVAQTRARRRHRRSLCRKK